MSRPILPDDFIPVSSPAAPSVHGPVFSADGRRIAFLQRHGGPDTLGLFVHDRDSGSTRLRLSADDLPPAPMTLAEELARERARQRFSGITHARWLPGTGVLWCMLSNRLVLLPAEGDAAPVVYGHPDYIEAATAAALPGGQAITFSAGGDLWRIAVTDGGSRFGEPRRLTDDGSDTVLNGIPDAMTREEIFNGAAFAAASEGRLLVWARFDTSEVERIDVGNGAQTRVEATRYARPGGAVAVFSIESLSLDDGASRRTLLPADAEWPYFRGLADWGPDTLLLTRLSRDQTRLQFLLLDLAAGSSRELLMQKQAPWINAIAPPMRRGDGSFFLIHENTGIGRVGLHDAQGRWQQDIGDDTVGHVDGLVGLAGDGLYFTATGPDAREHHVFHAAPADGWQCHRRTHAPGVHGATLAPDGQHWLHAFESMDAAPSLVLEGIGGGPAEHRFAADAAPGWLAGVRPPVLHAVVAADGRTPLHAAVYEPDAGLPGLRPVVLLVYGGPHLQAVRNAWAMTVDMRAQYLAQRGFYVVKVDNRGASGRGIGFELPVYGRLGQVEVDDQATALEQLLPRLPRADRTRVAACGWSYGGYMTLRCLQRRPDLFRAGVAGAPVVNWEDYDAPYTERYMGTPLPLPTFATTNTEGYEAGSVLRGEGQVQGALLLIHGMNDENVLLRHSTALMEDLARRRVPYELLLLPGERHGVRSATQRPYLELRIADFLHRVLDKDEVR
ncbi:MAG: prolyl oligopeptidase family serine peptidase [Aquincola tertiaricarbonis]